MKGRQNSQILDSLRSEISTATPEQIQQTKAVLSPTQLKVWNHVEENPTVRLKEIADLFGLDNGATHYYTQQCVYKLRDVKMGQLRKHERHSNPKLSILPPTGGRMVTVEEAMERYRMVNG